MQGLPWLQFPESCRREPPQFTYRLLVKRPSVVWVHAHRRELPARHIADVERVLGNTVISQWVAQQSKLTVLEEMQADRAAAVRRVA